ncbi:hypothetical protein HII12_005495, partial [Brettanomyces bruxellensis]
MSTSDDSQESFEADQSIISTGSDTQKWILIQEKTFFRWANMKLEGGEYDKIDSMDDLISGISLLNLINVLTQQKITPVYVKPKTKFQQIENLTRALDFIRNHEKLHLYNIGPEDIIDGNIKLILGLLWTLILKYSLQDGSKTDEKADDSSGKKEILLRWAQIATAEHKDEVKIQNFTTSWTDGLAFAALLDKYRPDLINYNKAKSDFPNAKDLTEEVIKQAETAGINRLIDAEDFVNTKPDEKKFHVGEILKLTDHNVKELEKRKSQMDLTKQIADLAQEKEDKNEIKTAKDVLRVRLETFIAVVGNIVAMKNRLLARMESLIVKMANWMAQLSFTSDEFRNLEDVLRFRTLIIRYRTSEKMKIFKELNLLISEKLKLNMCLRDYKLQTIKKAEKLMKQLNSFEIEAQKFVHEYIESHTDQMRTTFHKNASSIQLGLNLIESELSEPHTNTQEQLNCLTEVMNDLKSLELMTQRLDTYEGKIKSFFARIDKSYDSIDSDLKISKFKAKTTFFHDMVVDRLQFIDREIQKKEKVLRILKKPHAMKENVPPTLKQKTILKGQAVGDKKQNAEGEEADPKEMDGLALERYVFNKFDRGNKTYLNKAEFKEAFGYLYPKMGILNLENYLKSFTIQATRFLEVLRSTGYKGEEDDNEEEPSDDESQLSSLNASNSVKDEELMNMAGQFYLKTFEESSSYKEYITITDLKKLNLDERLRSRINEIFVRTGEEEESSDSKYNYPEFLNGQKIQCYTRIQT